GNVHVVQPEFDRGIEKRLRPYFERYQTIQLDNFKISADQLRECGHGAQAMVHSCK
ncbi:MAG: hypothetical protein H7X91_10195, partial [Burkholderiales bacterium]|nr:hypothetical protein [Burkholderiales bacterium]